MREIEFNAWDKEEKRMYLWKELIDSDDNTGRLSIDLFEDCPHRIYLQYTGLKDKNGRKIFENDIVIQKYESTKWVDNKPINYEVIETGIIEYIQGNCQYMINDIKNGQLYEISADCEIIGNKYENPELLR